MLRRKVLREPIKGPGFNGIVWYIVVWDAILKTVARLIPA